ncbi:MAG: DUF1552 domain-containing protein [Acidobacteriaceae bacterium]|nr:DUF1552 domain-containing protein [Acidobacteriaceae bacterium]MBV9502483.1 DUF1552 domain-containing protein [Acidobacteriaceae bacterium]
MIITRKHISRRTLLRGMGAAIALPMLDSMVPALSRATELLKKASPNRMVFAYVPNGIDMRNWTPDAVGESFTLPKILEPLAPLRDNVLVLSGLVDHNAEALGDGPGDHARASSSFLTGVHPKKTAGADIQVGISVDQVAAQSIGKQTRLASLELGCEDGHLAGNCDSGYSCAYVNSISWRTATVPNPPEVNPRAVFERLFGADEDAGNPAARARNARFDQSILDMVCDNTKRLENGLGATDRRKLDEYLSAIREVERQVQMMEKQAEENTLAVPTIARPDGIPLEFDQHAKLMFDLLRLALQTDTTRIGTFMLAREGSNRSYREIGVPDGHHGLSHHRNDPVLMDKIAKINRYHLEQFACFLYKLKSTPDGDGSLLDHTMIVYGSGISDGNRHNHDNLPVLFAGGSRSFRPGRHIRFNQSTPVANLYLSMLNEMGVAAEKLGDSEGRLNFLSDIA